uniref:Uncharacterized protein n=1 Tax=Nelumbo nucifera TaxID=4432 RepID=A0A822Z4E8_NELNU|nr:TPA_asm: hypothetical protein HUJ06_014255 [Nelumbo nucifera]
MVCHVQIPIKQFPLYFSRSKLLSYSHHSPFICMLILCTCLCGLIVTIY